MSRSTQRVLARDLREGADDVQQAAVKAGRRVAADARQLAGEAVSDGRALAGRAVEEARRRPGLAVAIAAGVAAIIGLLMIPRRRR